MPQRLLVLVVRDGRRGRSNQMIHLNILGFRRQYESFMISGLSKLVDDFWTFHLQGYIYVLFLGHEQVYSSFLGSNLFRGVPERGPLCKLVRWAYGGTSRRCAGRLSSRAGSRIIYIFEHISSIGSHTHPFQFRNVPCN